jgi:hypothetical protein
VKGGSEGTHDTPSGQTALNLRRVSRSTFA